MNNEAILAEVVALLAESECTLVYDPDTREYTLTSGPRYHVHELDICTNKLHWRVWDKSRQVAIAHFEHEREADLMADRYNNVKRDTGIKTNS